jgi:hypothetical protein
VERAAAAQTTARAKIAVTWRREPSVIRQVPAPEQAPLQPVNVDPADGIAASATRVPSVNPCPHRFAHTIPDGELVTRPAPAPATDTVSIVDGAGGVLPGRAR